jgi:hypothetical protein
MGLAATVCGLSQLCDAAVVVVAADSVKSQITGHGSNWTVPFLHVSSCVLCLFKDRN